MMILNEAKEVFINRAFILSDDGSGRIHDPEKWREACYVISKWLEQEPCEMTVEEYRQRMIQAFHNADTDELIPICALPTEKEFEHLEWLLKNHYKKEPCEDAISRQAVLTLAKEECDTAIIPYKRFVKDINTLPPVTPQPKIGYCRDCKWWKDSDGSFKRDIGAESQCPMNREEVYEGSGYCYMFKPRESEV